MANSYTAVKILQPESDLPPDMLKGLADELLATYHTSQSVPALEKAISIYEKVLQLRPLGHVCRAESLNDLGYAILHFCLDHETDQTRSNRCNELLREALCLRPPGHPLRDESLHNLARSLRSMLWQNLGGLDMLMECASLNREAVLLRLPGHPERAKSLNNLANDLTMIVEHTGDIEVLAEVVGMRREVLWLRPPGNPLRGSSLNNLALALCLHFEHLGGSELLAEAIDVTRDAMQLSPVGHPLRFSVLDSLAYALMIRSNHEGHSHSLSEANACMREALQMLSDHHPERSRVMGNLSGSLLSIFRSNGDRRALGEAIRLQREAVTLRSAGGYGHDDALDNLAEALEAKFDAENDTEALVEASSLHRETLRLRPIGHWRRFRSLEGLARVLCRLGCDSWPETLARYQEALELCPVGYPDRVRLLSGMSRCFLDQSSPSFSPSEGTLCLSKAYADPFTHVSRRLNSAILDLRKLEEAYDAYTKQAQIGSRIQDDDRVLDLYTQVISLLPLAANLGLDHVARLQAVTGCDEITRNAAARAMLRGCLPQAVEMLEQGRGVFWTQTLRLRTTAFENVPEDDCHELQRILRLLEHGARRAESSEQSADKRDRALEQRRQLNEAVQALISKIREYPGLDRFLLLPAFDALFGSLPDGFVVIVNASRLGHHALLLHRTTGLANSLALKPFRAGFDGASLGAQLPRDMASAPERDDDNETRAIRIKSGKIRCFEDVLSLLWTSVVQPIFNALGLNETQGRARPRLWWCVTGELGFLPIHAAGSYLDATPVCTTDYVVSSYIPTLASLTKARGLWTPIARSDLAGLLICETSTAEGSAAYLPDVVDEILAVRGCFASAGARVLNKHTTHTSASELRALLEEAPAQILHMACHGIQDSDPLKSSFLLHDGRLSIEDIIQLNLPHASVAFLSACQTAKGDQNSPDQAVHLAASMLFCGFRSVVGTMWSMCDEDGPKVARQFYNNLFERDRLDLDDIAYALDEAVQALRLSHVPASRWAPFMHIGG